MSYFQLDEPRLELGREYLINGMDDDTVKAYYKFMVENAIVFGANRTKAENEMKEALELEFKLANASINFCLKFEQIVFAFLSFSCCTF